VKRHEITVCDVAVEPVKARLASACGPNGSKTLEVLVNLRTETVTYLVNGVCHAWLHNAIDAYNEAPGP
jgi:hypothetical protein